MEKLINYKSDNINKLSIYLGSKKDSVLFKKNVNSNFYSKKSLNFLVNIKVEHINLLFIDLIIIFIIIH